MDVKKENNRVYIFGAHSRGQTLKEYLTFLYSNIEIEAYVVDDLENNEIQIDGIPVKTIDNSLSIDYPVFIATQGIYHDKIRAELQHVGMKEIIPVTVELDMKLRNAYVEKVYQINERQFILFDNINMKAKQHKKSGCIYVSSSIYDKTLKNEYIYLSEEKKIQVGAALTKKRISENILTDNEGINISNKNKQYCELTGLYWIWKHAKEDYIGLVHYRRHFLLSDNWIAKLEKGDIDVILPVPLYVAPSIAENYMQRHIASDWEYMMDYMKNDTLIGYKNIKRFFEGNLYSPCNMFIMRREILNELCCWLFPILDKITEHGGTKNDVYMNRYPGFISERLITLFFEEQRDKYLIAYANKNFLS